ncbi:Zinc finger protein 555 [Eumeta japonica]|uniref:Zinc finger protein 555 n=1 Tax=Eumeta variegata TaxID=151549 RepID=A0A4C1Z564_EUMVA|nr:Zinc finger protein 555 [Eumeta japonica]
MELKLSVFSGLSSLLEKRKAGCNDLVTVSAWLHNVCVDVCGSPSAGSGGSAGSGVRSPPTPAALALWPSPLLALHACRLRRYLSDDCAPYPHPHRQSDARRCALCLAAFPSAWLLERHAALQHAHPHAHAHVHAHVHSPVDDKPFVCEQCGQSYRYRSAYVKHREQNHRARLPADKLFTCDVCGMQFRYLKSFKKHRLNHTLERLHTKSSEPAPDLEVSSTDGGEIDLSVKRARERPLDPDQDSTVDSNGPPDSLATGDGSTDCRASSAERERRDEDTRRGARPAVSFASVSSIADSSEGEARADAESEPVASAGSAGLGFLSAEERQRERERERRFACPFCGKCVRSKENLKLHVRKHTGERPFVCLFCGRAFGGKSDLTRHLRIHTGERPYHCEACGKCFARADYLSKHLTTHVHNAR